MSGARDEHTAGKQRRGGDYWIHAWLGSQFGIVIWDRKVYFFENIPNRVDPLEMTLFACAAIAASVIGALIPAFIAARVNPIEALRYE